jgi:hypothetical protein
MIFEPAPVDSRNIEIVGEYEDIPEKEDEKTYLTETETNLLKYVNGVNTVRDLVELGVFTEYKVYKGLYNLIRKSIIRAKTKISPRDIGEEEAAEELELRTHNKMELMFRLLVILLLVILALRFFKPLSPLKNDNILLKTSLYETVSPETNKKPTP